MALTARASKEELSFWIPFDEKCDAFWNHYQELNNTYAHFAHHLKAPTYDQVVDWFKETYSLVIDPNDDSIGKAIRAVNI